MSKFVFLPLQGPNGERPKAPSVSGWQSPSYPGESVVDDGRWYGMRTDGLVVVDCDNEDAYRRWQEQHGTDTWVRKTPRGYHLIYKATPDSPTGPMVGITEATDIRAGHTSQIVFAAEGYATIKGGPSRIANFNPVWVPKRSIAHDAEEWDEIPDGRGNNTVAAILGACRRQGMSFEMMLKVGAALNRLTMTSDPMPLEMIGQIANSIARYEPDPDIDIVLEEDEAEIILQPEDVSPEDHDWLDARHMALPTPPDWLWAPYLPKGRLVMLDGQEGIGKGMFAVWAACNVTGGKAFPGSETATPTPVVWFTSEDDPKEDIFRRLVAAGYDQAAHAPVYFRNPRSKRLRFPRDAAELRKVVLATEKLHGQRPSLVIMDPGRSYLAPEDDRTESNYNNEAALRPGLEALMWMAHDLGVTILFIHHWNKMSQGSTRDKMGGSVSFLQAVRHRVTLAQVGSERAISVEKSNLSPKDHTVRSYDVVANEQYDTAVFKCGGSVPEYRDLDEWMKTMQKLADEDGPEIMVVIDWEEAAWHYSYLQPGELAPTAENIAKDLDVKLHDARTIRAVLVDKGVIDKGHIWVGQPAGNRKRRSPIEEGRRA